MEGRFNVLRAPQSNAHCISPLPYSSRSRLLCFRKRPSAPSPLLPKLTAPQRLFISHGVQQQIPARSTLPRFSGIRAMDAAGPLDYEEDEKPLKIGIVGFGNYGQFLAKTMVQQGHTVLAHSRTDYTEAAARSGVRFFRDADDFCEEHPEIILLCSSIISVEAVLKSLPTQRLKRSTLFADVLSVKEFPRRLFLQVLPAEFDVVCTHPMFGPESGKDGWGGLPFVYDKVRVSSEGLRAKRCERFLNIFSREGCRMVEMSCAEHDRYAAESQFITHTVGRMLGRLGLEPTPIATKGYEKLLEVARNTAGDSFDLYYGLFMYNVNSTEQLERLDMAFDSLKKQLVGRLHDILRRQLFGGFSSNENRVLKENSASVNGVLEENSASVNGVLEESSASVNGVLEESSASANGVVEENLVSQNGVDDNAMGRRIDEVSGSN